MNRRLSCLVVFVLSLGISNVSFAGPADALSLLLKAWLPQISTDEEFQNAILASDLTEQEIYETVLELGQAEPAPIVNDFGIVVTENGQPITSKRQTRCNFFGRTTCRNGDNCPFTHDPNYDWKSRNQKFFDRGKELKKGKKKEKKNRGPILFVSESSAFSEAVTDPDGLVRYHSYICDNNGYRRLY